MGIEQFKRVTIIRGNGGTRIKHAPMSLHPPQIPHDLIWHDRLNYGAAQADVLRWLASPPTAVVINLSVLTSVGAPNFPELCSYRATRKAG
jgi:hypothetical protein